MFTVTVRETSSNGQYVYVSPSASSSTQYHPSVTLAPCSISLQGALPGGKRLIRPLVVQVEEDDGDILISEPRFHIHASGSTLEDAIADFKRIISDELDMLASDEEKLGPRLQAQLKYLRSIVRMDS